MNAQPTRTAPAAILLLVAALLTGCAAATAPSAAQRGFSFALIGDMPYRAAEVPLVDDLIDTINADPSIEFVMHAGDIKGSGEPCSDALLGARYRQLQRIRTALVYTPGDNEWTDCHLRAAGRYDPRERLTFLRSLFFRDPHRSSGRSPIAVEPQSALPGFEEFVENALFVRERVVFATLHVVGSENDLVPWSGFDAADSRGRPRAERVREVEHRTAAALAWIDRAFDRAQAIDAAGVFLLMQASPRFDLAPGDRGRRPFDALIERLQRRAAAFGRPVVLAHGDQHWLIIDRPLAHPASGAPAANLTRIQTYGSPWIRWIRVDVDPASHGVFRFEPR